MAPAKRSIPERRMAPLSVTYGRFGNALDQLIEQRGGSVTDPSGQFTVHVMRDGGGSVIRLVPARGGNQMREWKLGSGAGGRVVSATISELLVATGQEPSLLLTSGIIAQPFVGTLKR
jgi:hypothetical protein